MRRKNATRATTRLIRRALGRFALRVALDVAAFGLALAALRLAILRFVAFDSSRLPDLLCGLFIVACCLALALIYRKKPGLFAAARRLESRDRACLGVLTAALELERDPTAPVPAPALADEILRRADSLLADVERLDRDELDAILFFDEEERECAARRSARRRRLETILRAVACLAFLAALASRVRSDVAPPRRPTPDLANATTPAENDSETRDAPDAELDPAEPARVDDPVPDGAIAEFRAAVDHAADSAASLEKKLSVSRPAALRAGAAFCRLARDPERSLPALARRALDEAAPNASDRPGLARAKKILAVAAVPFLTDAYLAQIAAFERALVAASGQEEALATIRATLDAASRLLAVVESARAFDAAVARYETTATNAYERALDALETRAGKFPEEEDEEGVGEAFDVALDSLEAALQDLRAIYEETLTLCAFASTDWTDSRLSEIISERVSTPAPRFDRIASDLDSLSFEADSERWGRIATYLDSARRFDVVFGDLETERQPASPACVAFSVTFGEVVSNDAAPPSLSGAPPRRTASVDAAPERDGAFASPEDALEGDVVASSEGRAGADSRPVDVELGEDAEVAETEARVGKGEELSERGAPSDARNDVGTARKGARSPLSPARGAFAAELPETLQEELDRARKWDPGEAELRRIDDYFDALRRVASEKDGETGD